MKQSHLADQVAHYGADQVSTQGLLSILLGSKLAEQVSAQGLRELSLLSVHDLQEIPGVGRALAARLHAALELGRRCAAEQVEIIGRFCRTEDVAAYFKPKLAAATQEFLYLVLLNCRNGAFRIRQVAQGGLTGISVTPADILADAVRGRAAGIILVHNHPSGDPTPSLADRELTKRVAEASELLGITLLDHVVVAREGHFSLMGDAHSDE